ncbi:GH92 family glycosyl hydrolase [Echinicola sp. CAU 1574]|uniref:GH92 family glycosyl hydrolase n=1 Tax=Echinicola arenosa TaxID=2774144 RepID=A0ABR9ARY2_9BACT|nr:GH92 family glycosyl hydrolase [Echinicola arenosa]MBD8491304.1 GH92 family glycosyl hydrolase [Echinicola arenosa]
MKKLQLIFLLIVLICSCNQVQEKYTAYVNPFIDTHKSRWFFFSSASRPFGMVNLSPDTWTKGSWNSGYLYDSTEVRCFSHIHAWQMAGIPVMPTSGEFEGFKGMEATKSSFDHASEIAKPGYHQINLDRYGIKAELTSTQRVGFHQYTFPAGQEAYISFHTGEFLAHGKVDSSMVRKVGESKIEGFSLMGGTRRRPKSTYVYFAAELDHYIEEFGGWEDGELLDANETINGKNNGAFVKLDIEGKPVKMKVAISYTSLENAWKNMEEELPHWDFDQVVMDSEKEWEEKLSRIKVKGGKKEEKVKFYTDLWHALLGRRVVSDVNGDYCDMTGESPRIRKVPLDDQGKPVFPQYNFDALWGSQWTLNVLWSMAYPEIMDGFCSSMVNMYHDGGLIPRGPSGGNYTYVMIGDPATSFFATAYNKGIRGYDIDKAYEGLMKNAFVAGIRDRAGYEHDLNPTGGGMKYYESRGYVPEGVAGNGGHKDGASMTLEYAYQDWCLAQLSKVLGKEEDYEMLMQRSQNYRNLWNPASKAIHPKDMEGNWIPDFTLIGEGFNTLGFCESNSAIYSHFVPHDMQGLIELFGGNEAYTEMLNGYFEKARGNKFITDHGKHAESWVDYENQPSCQMAHLFSHAGKPWLSQYWVREVKETTFGDTSPYGGYNGDEDQGQMGALGVLMAMGIFQVDGGAAVQSEYEITSPIFDKVSIDLNNDYYPGDKFEIITEANDWDEDVYIQSAKLNGEEWNSFHFPHELFAIGGKLEIKLSPQPNKTWGIK